MQYILIFVQINTFFIHNLELRFSPLQNNELPVKNFFNLLNKFLSADADDRFRHVWSWIIQRLSIVKGRTFFNSWGKKPISRPCKRHKHTKIFPPLRIRTFRKKILTSNKRSLAHWSSSKKKNHCKFEFFLFRVRLLHSFKVCLGITHLRLKEP